MSGMNTQQKGPVETAKEILGTGLKVVGQVLDDARRQFGLMRKDGERAIVKIPGHKKEADEVIDAAAQPVKKPGGR